MKSDYSDEGEKYGNAEEKKDYGTNSFGGVILVCLKRIFTDFDIDCEYAIALSYRMVRGDRMMAQMWEPHQTSGFINAFFIWIYMLLTNTTTGIALYLNVVGLFTKVGVAFCFYRTFRKYCEGELLFLPCMFFMAVNAKNSIILDFSNLMIYFSILLCCVLFTYLQRQSASYLLILAAVFFCLEILSYPSAIVIFPLILMLLYKYTTRRKRDVFLFSGVCIAFGGLFFLFLFLQTETLAADESAWSVFWICLQNIIKEDDSHQLGDFSRMGDVLILDVKYMVVLYAVSAIFAILMTEFIMFVKQKKALFCEEVACGEGRHKKEYFIKIFFMLLLAQDFLHALLDVGSNKWMIKTRLLYLAGYVPVMFLAFRLRRHCSREQRVAYNIGTIISIGSWVAVLMLTNLSLLTTFAYLILGVTMSMIPIGMYIKHNRRESGAGIVGKYKMLCLFMAVVLFRNIYVFRPMASSETTIFAINNVVRNGPMLGIFADYMGPHIRNCSFDEWKKYIHKGDKVLIVGPYITSTIGYLYEDTEISVDSTICTPTYNEKLLQYWEMNPWKEPNVVVLDCWFGESKLSEDEWIMQWIEENFDSYADGTYIRIYRRELQDISEP